MHMATLLHDDIYQLVREPVDIAALARQVRAPEDGAVVTFDGFVRNESHNRPTLYLDYEAYESMALAKWQQLRNMSAAHAAMDERVESERLNPPQYKHQGALVVSHAITGVLDEHPAMTKLNVERSRLERDYFRALSMLYTALDRRERKRGPHAEAGLAPAAEPDHEIAMPESEQPSESPEVPVGRIGLLPDEKIDANSGENPANSLETNEPPRVPLPVPEPVEQAPEPLSTHTAAARFPDLSLDTAADPAPAPQIASEAEPEQTPQIASATDPAQDPRIVSAAFQPQNPAPDPDPRLDRAADLFLKAA